MEMANWNSLRSAFSKSGWLQILRVGCTTTPIFGPNMLQEKDGCARSPKEPGDFHTEPCPVSPSRAAPQPGMSRHPKPRLPCLASSWSAQSTPCLAAPCLSCLAEPHPALQDPRSPDPEKLDQLSSRDILRNSRGVYIEKL